MHFAGFLRQNFAELQTKSRGLAVIMLSIACEKSLALVVEQQLAQFARKCLEEHSYWDNTRRLTKVLDNHIAIPVNAQCGQALMGVEGKTLHGNISHLHTGLGDTDGDDTSKMGSHQSAELAESGSSISESGVKSNIRKAANLPRCCSSPEKGQSTTSPFMPSSKSSQASKTGSRPFLPSDSNNETHEHLWSGRIFDFEAKLVFMNLPLSKKAKLTTPYDRLRIMIEGWVKEGKIAWKEELAKEIPKNWERHGDLVLLPSSTFQDPAWLRVPGLWSSVATTMNCTRIARRGRIQSDDFRSPRTELLLGTDPYVTHTDNGIIYTFNVCYSMFSSGNITEKLRIADLDCSNETIVDLYAGIGYFTLPYLVHARAKLLYACEWNPHAVHALRKNLKLNSVDERCVVLEGDNRKVCPKGVADRVNLGLIPSSEQGWPVACAALNPITGGILHIHGNVDSYPQQEWTVPKYTTTSDKPFGISNPDGKDCQRAADSVDERTALKPQLKSGDQQSAVSRDHLVPIECSIECNTGEVSNTPRDCPQMAADCVDEGTTLKPQLESGDIETAMSRDHMVPTECSVEGNAGTVSNTPRACPQRAADSVDERTALKPQLESGDQQSSASKAHMIPIECSTEGHTGEVSDTPIDCLQRAADSVDEGSTLKPQLDSGDLQLSASRAHIVPTECSTEGKTGEVSNIPVDCLQRAADCVDEGATLKPELESGNLQSTLSRDHLVPLDCSIDDNTGNTPDGVTCRNIDMNCSPTCTYKDSNIVSTELRVEANNTDQGICCSDLLGKTLKETCSEFKQKKWVKWGCYAVKEIKALLYEQYENHWNVEMVHIEHVKSYAPHIDHIVVDLRCQPIS